MGDDNEWLFGNAAQGLANELLGLQEDQSQPNNANQTAEQDIYAQSALQFLGEVAENPEPTGFQVQTQEQQIEQQQFEEAAAAFQNLGFELQDAADLIEETKHEPIPTAMLPEGARQLKGECSSEIILICTSLGSVRSSYFASKRAEQLLGCKRVPLFIIDVNKDVVQSQNLANIKLVDEWNRLNIPVQDINGRLVLPQIIIDGISVGNAADLQDLEEDNDLDFILERLRCPKCFADHEPNIPQCLSCGAQYQQLISDELAATDFVVRFLGGKKYKASEPVDLEAIPEPPPLQQTKVIGFNDLFGPT